MVIDTTASPRTTYRYKAIQLEGTATTLESDVVQVTTLDTTSHVVQWVVDTLGVRGEIYDVWAFSKDQIWAVGEIYLRDSTGNEDPRKYNLARWDGRTWSITRLLFEFGAYPIRSIYAFTENDVWLASGANFFRCNGSTFSSMSVQAGIIQGELLQLWGTSSNNLICVGRNGTAIRFDGTRWQKMESGTTVDLQDVWGIDDQHVWATGTRTDLSRSVILEFNGKNWSVLYDSYGQPRERALGFSSIWTDSRSILYLAGVGGWWSISTKESTLRKLHTPGTYAPYRVRATGQNDLFVTGTGSEALHYNGSTWILCQDVKALGEGYAHWFCVHPAKDFIAIGGYFFTGLYGVPVVLRGSR